MIKSIDTVIPQIYCYTTPGVIYHDGWCKIGYTEQKVEKIIIFKNLGGQYSDLQSWLGEEISDEDAKNGVQPKAIYYVSDEAQQAQYISMFKDAGLDAVMCDTLIDPHFISYIEYKNPKKCRFVRIDADIDSALKSNENVVDEDQNALIEKVKECLENKDITVKAERFKSGKIPAVINVDEFMRRMSEMGGYYGMEETDTLKGANLVLNLTNPVVSSLLTQSDEKQKIIVNQIYYLAMLAYKKLSPKELSDFMEQSASMLFEYSKK